MLNFSELTKLQADSRLYDYCYELLETKLADMPEQESRNQFVDELTESYFAQYNKMPSSRILELLADYIMLDHIRDPDVYKMNKVPILTERQMKTRRRKEAVIEGDAMDFLSTEISWNTPKQRTTKELSLND